MLVPTRPTPVHRTVAPILLVATVLLRGCKVPESVGLIDDFHRVRLVRVKS